MKADSRRVPSAQQRDRLLCAAESLLAERGSYGVSVNDVCGVANVPRRECSSLFADREAILLALFEQLTGRIATEMALAYDGEHGWLDGVRAAMLRLLSYLESEPAIARFLLVESMSEERILSSRSELMALAARALQADSPPLTLAGSPAPFGSDAVVGTVASVLHGRLLEHPVPPLRSLGGALMGLIVLPFLGAEASREELSRSLPDAA